MSKFAILLILLLSTCKAERKNGLLSLIIENDEVKISRDRESARDKCKLNCVQLRFKLINTSDTDIILYGFNTPFELGEFDEKSYCDSYLSAGRYVFIFDNEQKQMIPAIATPGIVFHSDTVKKQIYPDKRVTIRDTKQIIKKNETLSFTETINLRDFYLYTPSTYSLKLNYYQCDVTREISQWEIEEDIKKYDGHLFKGSLMSNHIKLIVE